MYELHPYLAALPPPSIKQIVRVTNSIRDKGTANPVLVTSDGFLLDGRVREAACKELGITPDAVVMETTAAENKTLVMFYKAHAEKAPIFTLAYWTQLNASKNASGRVARKSLHVTREGKNAPSSYARMESYARRAINIGMTEEDAKRIKYKGEGSICRILRNAKEKRAGKSNPPVDIIDQQMATMTAAWYKGCHSIWMRLPSRSQKEFADHIMKFSDVQTDLPR